MDVFVFALKFTIPGFEFGKTKLEEIFLGEMRNDFKDSHLKILIKGINMFFQLCSKKSNIATNMIEVVVQGVLNWIKKYEEMEFIKTFDNYRNNSNKMLSEEKNQNETNSEEMQN